MVDSLRALFLRQTSAAHLFLLVLPACVVLAGCNSSPTMPADSVAAHSTPLAARDDLLLDIGIGIFAPGAIESTGAATGVFPGIRRAEARYLPFRLMQELQSAGEWGSVRIVPGRHGEMDLWVSGEILRSDGERLALRIVARDSTGKAWYTKSYEEPFTLTTGGTPANENDEPFRDIYRRIAGDLAADLRRLDASDLANIRKVAELRHAQRFAPEIFGAYLEAGPAGARRIVRLPSSDSPELKRITQFRRRDAMFIDTLQAHYAAFARRMEGPYRAWLVESYRERLMLRSLQDSSNHQILEGVLTVFSSLNPLSRHRLGAQADAPVGVAAGTERIKSGLDARRQGLIHTAELQELGASLSAAVQPSVIKVDERTVTLTGTVDEQFTQWQRILEEIYRLDAPRAADPTAVNCTPGVAAASSRDRDSPECGLQ